MTCRAAPAWAKSPWFKARYSTNLKDNMKFDFLKKIWAGLGAPNRALVRALLRGTVVHVAGDVARVVDKKTGTPIAEVLVGSITSAPAV